MSVMPNICRISTDFFSILTKNKKSEKRRKTKKTRVFAIYIPKTGFYRLLLSLKYCDILLK